MFGLQVCLLHAAVGVVTMMIIMNIIISEGLVEVIDWKFCTSHVYEGGNKEDDVEH